MICEIERHIGQQLKKRRQDLNLTQQQVAETLGVTGQQIYKYEQGVDRLAASRLLKLSKILCVPISFFYKGLEEAVDLHQKKEIQVTCANAHGKQFIIKFVDPEGVISDIAVL